MTRTDHKSRQFSTLTAGFIPRHLPVELRGRVVAEGFKFWSGKCRPDRLPSRADFTPAELGNLLPQVVLLDVLREPWDFRFRLIGTGVVLHLSADWTGMRMTEIPHMCPPSKIFSNCQEAALTGEPVHSQTPYVGPHREFLRADDVILPLAKDGKTPDMLLVFVEYLAKEH